MMNNENGYALPIVLLSIVVFTVLALSFFGQSINSSKQNNLIETKSQSVALAEMGIEFFYEKVSASYQKNTPIVVAYINELKEKHEKEKKVQPPEYYDNEALKKMKELLQADLFSNEKLVSENTRFLIKINNDADITPYLSENSIVINFLSEGIEKSEHTEISGTFTINMNGRDINSGSDLITVPDFNSIQRPINISSKCINPEKNKDIKGCSEILITKNEIDFENLLNNKGKLTIFSDLGLDLKNANNMKSVRLHVEDKNHPAGLDGKNLNKVQNSLFEILGTAVFDKLDLNNNSSLLIKDDLSVNKDFAIDDSKVFVGKTLTSKGEFDIDSSVISIVENLITIKDIDVEDSKIYVGKNLYVGEDFKIDNSFVHINGNAGIKGELEINENSKVCVKGELSYNKLENKGQLFIYNNSPDLFEKHCGGSGSANNQIDRTIEYSPGKK